MKREEAIAILNRRTTIPGDGYSFDDINEAIDMAINALRSITREQVERAWSGCTNCKEDGEGYVQKLGTYSIQSGELATGPCKSWEIKFCPYCSLPLTDDAGEIWNNETGPVSWTET